MWLNHGMWLWFQLSNLFLISTPFMSLVLQTSGSKHICSYTNSCLEKFIIYFRSQNQRIVPITCQFNYKVVSKVNMMGSTYDISLFTGLEDGQLYIQGLSFFIVYFRGIQVVIAALGCMSGICMWLWKSSHL